MKQSPEHTEQPGPLPVLAGSHEYLDFVGSQTMVVDPRAQGFGLSEYGFLDPYANKFFILSGGDGAFVSPAPVSERLLEYYDGLSLDVAKSKSIINVGSGHDGSSVIQRLATNRLGQDLLTRRRGEFVVPYMMTAEVEAFAEAEGFNTLASAAAISRMGDKAHFQRELGRISDDVHAETGFAVAIQTMPEFYAGDRHSAIDAYTEISHGGRRDIMVIKPKSASALGVFVSRAAAGETGMHTIINEHFDEGERVLLEERVRHNHSPSMQGTHTIAGDYEHLYFGTQLLSDKGDAEVQYDGSEIPFGATTVEVRPEELARARRAHEQLGELIIKPHGIHGIAGFDAVMDVTEDGQINDMKVVELNVHLPGSFAMYAAMVKIFPDGFRGVARNWSVPLASGETAESFLEHNRDLLVAEPQSYGLFPLNMSYADKVDVIAFAPDAAGLKHLVGRVNT